MCLCLVSVSACLRVCVSVAASGWLCPRVCMPVCAPMVVVVVVVVALPSCRPCCKRHAVQERRQDSSRPASLVGDQPVRAKRVQDADSHGDAVDTGWPLRAQLSHVRKQSPGETCAPSRSISLHLNPLWFCTRLAAHATGAVVPFPAFRRLCKPSLTLARFLRYRHTGFTLDGPLIGGTNGVQALWDWLASTRRKPGVAPAVASTTRPTTATADSHHYIDACKDKLFFPPCGKHCPSSP